MEALIFLQIVNLSVMIVASIAGLIVLYKQPPPNNK